MKHIERVTVLGAGTMGARIAALLANAGVSSFLLDMAPPGSVGEARNHIAQAGLEAVRKARPAALTSASLANLITVGNFDDHLGYVADSDWVIEAVVEDLEIKRALLKKVEAIRRPGTIVTTNTSGLPVSRIAEGFSDDFRRHWFGTHFFNPPRYMRLLEIIPTPETDEDALKAIANFSDVRLGKGTVFAKDTPNFIANRIGAFSVLNIFRLMQQIDMSIEEVDALTGTVVGWPKSATFRTMDMVGLDVLGHVVHNLLNGAAGPGGSGASRCGASDERSELRLPEFFNKMLERRWLGDKTGGGFYKKIKSTEGEQIFGIDWKTIEYRPRQKAKFPVLEMASQIEDARQRLPMLLGSNGSSSKPDRAGQFLWSALSDLWTYAANRIGEISDSIVEIDRAMCLGFNWEMGPFELWDAAGVEATVARMKKSGQPIAPNVERLLASGRRSWYIDEPSAASACAYFDLRTGGYESVPVRRGTGSVRVAKKVHGVVKKNPGASLVDLGDGIGCLEFHSKMNVIGGDIITLVSETLKNGTGETFDGFVITNDAPHFCAGANLMLLLLAIQEEEWDEIDLMVRSFQQMAQSIKFSPKPVVVAPFGMTLGGGCEIALHGAARQPHAELYMGLVEAGVGLLPAGGGLKEMLLRAMDRAEAVNQGGRGQSVESVEALKKVFEAVGMAKVSTSAEEARGYGFLSPADQVTMNRERVVADAKARALDLIRVGYRPPRMRNDIFAPGENVLAMLKLGVHILRQGAYISEHDQKIGIKIAEVLCAGNVTPNMPVSEQYILDLEREAFKSLCGEPKTRERIAHMLKTGRPLRN
jgi:3-hydroxyacyl-CoA dehydrogenase